MKIGTHDGTFHCDEVFACYMLKLLPEYKDAEIVRTRDMNKLKECDIVVDVGSVFDHDKKLYDHHQREFNETLSSLRPELGEKYKIKLSSAGLVYIYYGERVIQAAAKDQQLTPHNLSIIYKKVYENLVEEIDAIDNGVPMTDSEPRYKIRTHLSSRVHRINPRWNSDRTIDYDDLFKKAMFLVGEEFLYTIEYFISVWLPARNHVQAAVDNRFKIHESGQILKFECGGLPWKEHLFDIEEALGIESEIKYVLFEDKSWRVQAVPVSPTSFILRKPLNKDWWGVRDEELSRVSGVEGAVFCHSTGFIGGNASYSGALDMATKSLLA
ncbi:unnamed protein product, partial [Brenthis ino]